MPEIRHLVTATYEIGGPVDFEVVVGEKEFSYRAKGERKWVRTPWNELFATIDAAKETDNKVRVIRMLMDTGAKPQPRTRKKKS